MTGVIFLSPLLALALISRESRGGVTICPTWPWGIRMWPQMAIGLSLNLFRSELLNKVCAEEKACKDPNIHSRFLCTPAMNLNLWSPGCSRKDYYRRKSLYSATGT